MPTPTGVPVAMMSPGYSVMPADRVAIRLGMLKIRPVVRTFWRSSPLTHRRIWVSSPLHSSALTAHGPMGQKVSKLLPISHCLWRICQSRAVTSLMIV